MLLDLEMGRSLGELGARNVGLTRASLQESSAEGCARLK